MKTRVRLIVAPIVVPIPPVIPHVGSWAINVWGRMKEIRTTMTDILVADLGVGEQWNENAP